MSERVLVVACGSFVRSCGSRPLRCTSWPAGSARSPFGQKDVRFDQASVGMRRTRRGRSRRWTRRRASSRRTRTASTSPACPEAVPARISSRTAIPADLRPSCAAGLAQMHTGGAPADGFSYAFGWRDGTIAGERAVHHGGIVPHCRGKMVMLPDRRLGVVVLTNVSSAIPWPIAPTSHVMADEIAAALIGVTLPVPSDTHRWLFGAIDAAMLLVTLGQLRGLRRILRGRNSGDRAPRAAMSTVTDLAFVAAVAFVIPRLAGLSWSELLSAAPDVAWWLIIAATVSLVTVWARLVPGSR